MSVLGTLGITGWASQTDLQNQLNNQLGQTIVGAQIQQVAMPTMRINVAEAKAQAQVKALVDQIPMSLARHILSCAFFNGDQDVSSCFVVTFYNGHQVRFIEIDEFPSDKHIARIALDCP